MGVVVAAVVLAALEGLARLLSGGAPSPDDVAAYGSNELTWHPTRLWSLMPGTRKTIFATCSIGEDGLRGSPPEVPRPTDRQRILVLGDSSWFGAGLADDQTLAVQLEARLRQRGLDVEVVNGGVPGYSTEQTLLELEEIGWGYDPTLLMIGALWSDSNYDAFRDADLLRRLSLTRSILGRSSLFRGASRVLAWLGGQGARRLVTWPTAQQAPEWTQRRVPVVDYARNLDTMIRDARARGVGAVLLAPGNKPILQHGLTAQEAWYPYFRAQERVAEHHGVPLLRAWEALGAQAGEGGLQALFLDEMHPSALGQALIADAATALLVEAGWPGARLTGVEQPFDLDLVGTDPFRGGNVDLGSIQMEFLVLSEGQGGATTARAPRASADR
ncbi:MAG: GDSL-type esterase/lipase family protein [Pseudomonadota bacterium]